LLLAVLVRLSGHLIAGLLAVLARPSGHLVAQLLLDRPAVT
jgi:hypothetical protein